MFNIEDFRNFCLGLKGTSEGLPFDQNVLVFYVGNKMFALTDINQFESINLKCDPELALELREKYPSVIPGYHMNKKHWNTVIMDGSIDKSTICEWIKNSYDLVYKNLSKRLQKEIEELV